MTNVDMNFQLISVRVPEDHDRTKPIPLILKVNTESPNLWATGDGRRVLGSEELAAKAMEMDTDEYKQEIRKQMKASRLVRAQVIENYSGWVTTTGDEDDYFAEVEELMERHGDNLAYAGVSEDNIPAMLPSWAFCCTEQTFDFDLEAQLDSYLSDNHHEDARDFLVDEKGLWAFWNEWVKKQSMFSFYIDTTRIVVIDRERYEAEITAAKLYLEGNRT